MLDEDLNYIKWNENFRKILGYSDEEIARMKPADFYEDETIPLISEKIQKVYENGSANIEVKVRKKSGELIPLYLIARRLTRENNIYIIGTGIDVSEKVEVTQKLAESEKRWQSLVQNDPNLIQMLTPDGTIEFINESGAKLIGFDSADDLIGKNYFDEIHIEENDLILSKERFQKVIEGQKIDPQIFRVTTANGKERFIESQAVPITLEDGRPGLQQVAQDVTGRIEYEQELKESLKEKETLLQEIHHRVKNNPAVVSSMLQLQAFNTENPEVQKLLGTSEKRIKTMALIHEQLYQSHSLSRIDFEPYIKKLVNHIQNVNHQKQDVKVRLETNSFDLNVNQAVPFALILNEAISNSYEHAFKDQSKGKICVSLEQKGDMVFAHVSDNGSGLDTDFEARKNKSMGFTIINTLIKQLNADYDIESDNGLSLSFSFKKREVKGSTTTLI